MQNKTYYVCRECQFKSTKWLGKCPECLSWNSFEETIVAKENKRERDISTVIQSIPLSNIQYDYTPRYSSGINELDRVLGGGIVNNSVILLCGEPGIGKSTLLLQIGSKISDNKKVLYVSGEESASQIKLRADRILDKKDCIMNVLAETDQNLILDECSRIKPDVLIVDSIQTIFNEEFTSSAGSIVQVRECAAKFIHYAKKNNCCIFLIGHVNKEGEISGPKTLEHMVDTVLYFEGEKNTAYRIIRSIKNRFGSTNEIGVFEMDEEGLIEVENPSQFLIGERPEDYSGNAIGCVMEGTRPILCNIQSLVSKSVFPTPRRMSNGVDYNRLSLILAVIEKKLPIQFSQSDVYVNVAAGLKVSDPSADAAIVLSILSSVLDIVVNPGVIVIGEIGLSGEIRTVPYLEKRIIEATRIGFNKLYVPYGNYQKLKKQFKTENLVAIKSVEDVIKILKK